MSPLIRISLALVISCFSVLNGFAGSGSVKPVKTAFFKIMNIRKLDSFLSARVSIITINKETELSVEKISASSDKICSCQVLNMESQNYNHRYVVLLAEKRNDGSSLAFEQAKSRIQKEKKHLKKMFYDKIKVVAEMQGTGSCKAMFFQLRTADSKLQLYEILNADTN